MQLKDKRWLGVELRHLAALEAERSFRRAAERLGYSQGTVSQQLSNLERLVGARLVNRTRGRSQVELTQAGSILLHHAEQILATLGAARADLEALSSGSRHTVRLAAFPGVAARVIPPVLARLALADPGLRVHASESSSDGDLFSAVLPARSTAPSPSCHCTTGRSSGSGR